MRNLKAGNNHPNPSTTKRCLLRLSDPLGDRHQMAYRRLRQIDPFIDLDFWYHQDMTGCERVNRQEDAANFVGVDERGGDITGEDSGEDAHGAMVGAYDQQCAQ